jgi:hypothetical protein
MQYTDFQYLWPPRPETKIAKPMLGFYQKRGYLAQKKKNGTCTLIFAKGNQVIFKTRHNDDHKLWTPQDEHMKFFSGGKDWNVFVAELLHSKVTGGPKNELYIFDQIVRDGVQLVGETFLSRQMALLAKFAGGKPEDDCYRLTPKITLAKNFTGGFTTMFDTLKKEDEGLVLKDPKAVLRACLKPDSNKGWQVKCRIAHSNYSF